MSIFTGRGQELEESLQNGGNGGKPKLDYKKLKFKDKLDKENSAVAVRVLSPFDYTSFQAHGHYKKGIYTTPCTHAKDVKGEYLDPNGRCLYCEAVEKGFETDQLKGKTRFLFAFYDLEEEMVKVLETSYTQGKSLVDDIKTYRDELGTFAFNLKRKGTGTDTKYVLEPVLKMQPLKEKFDNAKDATYDEAIFEAVLYIKKPNQQAIDLENAGFEVEKELGFEIVEDAPGEEYKKNETDVF